MCPSRRNFTVSCMFILLGVMPATGEHRYRAHRRQRSTFLGAVDAAMLNKELQHAIMDSLGNELNHAHMAAVKVELNPMWQALAKDAYGRVDLRTLRYALQRYMHQKYYVSILGLELGVNDQAHSASIMSHAPQLVADILHGNSTSAEGFNIDDLVTTIAMLEQLLMQSGSHLLGEVYDKFGLHLQEPVARATVNDMMGTYLLRWMGLASEDVDELEADTEYLLETLPEWPVTSQFAHGLVDAFEYARASSPRTSQQGSHWRPMRASFSFADMSAVVGKLPLSFGEFWRDQCDEIKDSLLQLDHHSMGRVKLSDFHGEALGGEWRFTESKEYLRELGALDESSIQHGPRVIIPNYLYGPSNCIISDTYYRVCCYNDCEGYMAEIEESVASPTATPEQLLDIVFNITVNVADAGVAITSASMSQLAQIAQLHEGRIPLHGRLFAQWLHYVFPRDCPFPHRTGTVTKLMPMEFGNDWQANDAEMRLHVRQNRSAENVSQSDWMSQWSEDEELLTGDFDLKAPWEGRSRISTSITALVALILMLIVSGYGRRGNPGRNICHMQSKVHSV